VPHGVLSGAILAPRHGKRFCISLAHSPCAWLHPDRMPDGLQLEERGDLVRTLRIGPRPHDPLHVLCAEPLELRDIAVRPRDIEREHVHMRRDRRRELTTKYGDDVHITGQNISDRTNFCSLLRHTRETTGLYTPCVFTVYT